MAHQWEVWDNAQRLQWGFAPLVSVGPVHFDMDFKQVEEAMGDGFHRYCESSSEGMSAVFSPPGRWGGAITTYYDELGLAAIAVHARKGPQVSLFEMELVCRLPSELEDEFCEKSELHGYDLCYGPQADVGSRQLGVVLRAERAGDYARSRPVFVAARWADMCADAYEGRVPQREWRTFLS